MEIRPTYAAPDQLLAGLRQRGYVLLDAHAVAQWLPAQAPELEALQASWDRLPPDGHLKDGGKYRRRRHASYVVEDATVRTVAHRAHWQPLEYNALHGGMVRWFEPVEEQTAGQPVWNRLLARLAEVASGLRGAQPWFVEAHQFRIDTEGGIGRPTPEGAHRDGVDLVAVFLVGRSRVRGGESRVFDIAGPAGERFTLREPWSLLLLDDERVIHETTPIQPDGGPGHRDTLVVTLRRESFLGA